jgi:hypothetical protein
MTMKSKTAKSSAWISVLFFACVLAATFTASAQTKTSTKTAVAQTGFDTPESAAAALIDAAGKFDVDAFRAILGPDGTDIVESQDQVRDKSRAAEFAKLAAVKKSIELSKGGKQATLAVGPNDWPLPIPIVKRGGKWYFNTKQGRTEIVARRIGSNELDAIAICRGFVEAQKQYAATIHDDSGVNQYAQRIISTPGKQDGLYWTNPDGTGGGPISEAIARALQEGYTKQGDNPTPFHGYYFKVLKGRGPSAPGGEVDFIIEGLLIGGFALAATPAQYGVTGIKTFMISYEGIVYEKDLGPDSLKLFSQIDRYNPDKTWAQTDDQWPDDAVSSRK